MARYPQGVKTFIPQIQPYQVDFNFVNNVLKTKQSQYDTNWKQLNKLYGQIYYADLTREESKAKQEALVKQIDFNLKRISTMDLSLDQNVQAAKQIFQPFYEDKNLMKDIAWTKNTSIALSGAESLRNSSDEEQRARYWQDGVNAINYRIDEFKETPYDQIQSQANVRYTPYVDVMAKAEAISKEFGDMVVPSFSEDNRWILSTTNGEVLRPHLQKLFQLRMANDPAIQELYRTQAYVDRKNYMYQNADKYGGDRNAAERAYLTSTYELLKPAVVKNNQELKEKDEFYRKTLQTLEKNNNSPRETVHTKELIESYSKGKELNDGALVLSEKEYQDIKEGRSTLSTSTGPMNATEDLSLLRTRVDNLRANQLMRTDFTEAADVYAFRNFKQEIEENPYEMEKYKQQNRIALETLRGRNAMKVQKAADRAAMRREMGKYLVERGDYEYFVNTDEEGNEFIDFRPIPEPNSVQAVSSGETAGIMDAAKEMNSLLTTQDNDISMEVRRGLTFAENVLANGNYTDEQQREILGGYTLQEALEYVNTDYKDKKGFSLEELVKIHNGVQDFILGNNETSRLANDMYSTGAQADEWKAYQTNAHMLQQDIDAFAATVDHQVYLNVETRKALLEAGGNNLAAIVAMGAMNHGVGEEVYTKLLTEMGAIDAEDVRLWRQAKVDEHIDMADDQMAAMYLELGDYKNYGLTLLADALDFNQLINNRQLKDLNPFRDLYRAIKGAGAPEYEDAIELGRKMYNKVAEEKGKALFFAGQIGSGMSGIYSQGSQVMVMPNATNSDGFEMFYQSNPTVYAVENDLSEGLEPGLTDPDTYMFSFDPLNTTPTEMNEDGVITDRQAALNSIRAIMNRRTMQDYADDGTGITVKAVAATGFDGNKSAYMIKPPTKWIDDNTASVNDEGELTKSGLFTVEQAQRIKNNGIHIIADRGTFKSDLMNTLMKDKVTMILDNSPTGEYTTKVGNNELHFKRNPSGEITTDINLAVYDYRRQLLGDGRTTSMTQDLGSYGLYKDVGEKSTDEMSRQFIQEHVPRIQMGNNKMIRYVSQLRLMTNSDGTPKYTNEQIVSLADAQTKNFYYGN